MRLVVLVPAADNWFAELQKRRGLSRFDVAVTKSDVKSTLSIPFKKARIMDHWATRVGAQIKVEVSDADV